MTAAQRLDTDELSHRVKAMYTQVADEPDHDFHFETGRALAQRLGYPVAELDANPAGAQESFARRGLVARIYIADDDRRILCPLR